MTLPAYENLSLSLDRDALTVRLCRPERLNTVTTGLLQELVDLAGFLRGRPDIHFLVLGHDGKYMSAGANLALIREMIANPELMRIHQNMAHEMISRLSSVEQISFAAIEGSVYGAGVAIAMTCDFRVMADHAVMNLPETRRGMFLTYGATPRLVHLVGLAKAKELIMFAEDCPAQQCLAAGLVQHVVPAGEVHAKIQDRIEALRKMSWRSVRIAKRIANAAVPAEIGNMIMPEPELVECTLYDSEMAERLDDFLQKRG